MIKRICCACILAIALVLGSGCTNNSVGSLTSSDIRLPEPPPKEKNQFLGESLQYAPQTYSLYYSAPDRSSFETSHQHISGLNESDVIYQLVQRLLQPSEITMRSAAAADTSLLSLEFTGTLATVDFSLEALNTADDTELLLLAYSVANTLLETDAVEGVNILIGGRHPNVCTLPIGVITQKADNATAAYAQAQTDKARAAAGTTIERTAAVYLPSDDGLYIYPVMRQLTFTQQVENALFDALEQSLLREAGYSFAAEPTYRITASGQRILEVDLSGKNSVPWYIAAGITVTATSFLQETDAVRIYLQGAPITAVEMPNGKHTIEDGCFRRSLFAQYIGGACTLYFENDTNKLIACTYITARTEAQRPMQLLRTLFSGPNANENSIASPFPQGVSSADILGVSVENGIADVNLSANFYRICQNINETEERNAVYAIVNTLCELPGINGVRLYVEGISANVLTQHIYLRSILLPVPVA